MRREANGPAEMKAKHTCCLSNTAAFNPLSRSCHQLHRPPAGRVDSGSRGGCYQLSRSEPQGKGRVADKLSGAWEPLQAQAHDPPPCFSLANSWGCGGSSSLGLRPRPEGGRRQLYVPLNMSCLNFLPNVQVRIPEHHVLYLPG